MLVDRLLVKLIKEPFESPDFIPEAEQDNTKKKHVRYKQHQIGRKKLMLAKRNEVLIIIAKI